MFFYCNFSLSDSDTVLDAFKKIVEEEFPLDINSFDLRYLPEDLKAEKPAKVARLVLVHRDE
jgi:hypothetical protein